MLLHFPSPNMHQDKVGSLVSITKHLCTVYIYCKYVKFIDEGHITVLIKERKRIPLKRKTINENFPTSVP